MATNAGAPEWIATVCGILALACVTYDRLIDLANRLLEQRKAASQRVAASASNIVGLG